MKINWPPVSDIIKFQEETDFDYKLQNYENLQAEINKPNDKYLQRTYPELNSNDNFANLYAYIRSTLVNDGSSEYAFEELSGDEKKILKLLMINLLKNLEENGISEEIEKFRTKPSKIESSKSEKIKSMKQIVSRLAEDGLL
jgi:hypothetical protein